MKFLKEWINDNDYFVYNELKEIEERTNRTFKKANLNNPKITVAIKILNNVKITENDFKEFITKVKGIIVRIRVKQKNDD